VIELVRAGRTAEELSREFEASAQAIRNGVAQANRDEGRRSDGVTSAEREEVERLRREVHAFWAREGNDDKCHSLVGKGSERSAA